MKQLNYLFKDFLLFFKNDFNLKAYLFTFLFIAGSIYFIYAHKWGLEFLGGGNTIFRHYLMYLFVYFSVLFVTICLRGCYKELNKPILYFKVFLFMGILAFTDAFSWREHFDFSFIKDPERSYLLKVLWRSRNVMFMLPILITTRYFIDKNVIGLYGLSNRNQHIKAYLLLYLFVLPFLLYASFTPDFQSYYPSYRPIVGSLFSLPAWLTTLLYESVYMVDFVMVELFFRGVLVIGMISLLGRKSVLPMIAVYVALHFGKPMLETCSAMLGGYVLGALAYQTKHIWGGVIIHMGIALTIDILGLLQLN